MADDVIPAAPPSRPGLIGLLVRLVRLPFDLVFLTWDFARLSIWGLMNLPSLLSGSRTQPFGPCFSGGILEEMDDGACWYCPLAPKYGTKSLLRLLFSRLGWYATADGARVLSWQGHASRPPTTLGRYLLTGLLLGLFWAALVGCLAWPHRHRVPWRTWLAPRPPVEAESPAPRPEQDPELAAQYVVQAMELERQGLDEAALTRFREAIRRDPKQMLAHLGVGRISLDLGLADEARAAFAKAAELQPGDLEADLGLARALQAQGAHRKALELLSDLIRRRPEAAEAYGLQAGSYIAINDLDAAAQAVGKALELAPSDEKAIAVAADVELRRGFLDRAEKYYRSLVDRNSANLEGRVGLARILRRKGNLPEAELQLRTLLQESPDAMAVTEELVEVLLAGNRPLEALALCAEAAAAHPNRVRLRERQLSILALLGRDDEVYSTAQKLLSDHPGNVVAHIQLAAMFLRKNLPTLAQEHCAKALAQQPGMEAAYRLETTALLQRGDLEQARDRLERLLAVMPRDLEAMVKMADYHRRKGARDRAVEVLKQAVAAHPGSPLARAHLAQMLFAHGEARGALAEFREALRLSPDDPKALNNLAAAIHYTDGDLDEALALAQRARDLDPGNAQILDTLGWVHHRRGEHAAALPLAQTAVALQPDLPILRYHHGAILAALGRQDEAKAALQRAVAFGVEFQGLDDARALLQRLSGDGAAPKP